MALATRVLILAQMCAGLAASAPVLASDALVRPETATGISYPEYFCTNRGERVDIDEYSCLNIDGKTFQAQCDISLNDPMWRLTGEACETEVTSDILPEPAY